MEKISKNLQNKMTQVEEIKARFEKAKSVVLIDYRGLTVAEVTELRNQFRAEKVEYVVLKNTLIQRAVDALGIEGLDPYLAGPTAVAFGIEDAVSPAKVIVDFQKKVKKTELKAGLMDGKILSVADIKALAELPPREVLLAQVLGTLNAPISGFVNVLAGTIRSVVNVLDAIRKQKEEG